MSEGDGPLHPPQDGGLELRDPEHRVSTRAVAYWTTESLIGQVIFLAILTGVYLFALPERWWWATAILVVAAVVALVDILVKPRYRYAVHRWEVTPTAVYTRTGWVTREQRIAPLSRVQTVDSKQGPLMRMFKIASITVTTASAAGPISIVGLDKDVAERLVAELTEITGSIEGDAT
ncbi:PH domain-containing protein [Ornithinicoccus hortensis]|uniref:YdbS-like PH domain-containing protein n=1 Tax=Ornithinicoccus hortensis TaxID=82346 RepID=A0A542YVL4_9MICO|nr:PH domain-containing protein [Ornithinicoccus hortensis]TQL52120.1 hypothetical protein FB467_3291 [Ornithinicoccus hortensis]